MDEVQKNLELRQIEQCILNSKKSKVKKLLVIVDIRRDKDWLDCIAKIYSHGKMVKQNYCRILVICPRNSIPLKLWLVNYNITKSKLSFNEQTFCLELLNTWHRNNDKRYLNHCPGAPVYTTNVFLKLLTGGKKLEDDLQELSLSASHKQVCPLSPTGSVGNLEIIIWDYFQLSNNSKQKEQVAESKGFSMELP
ncbi:hypothetical protein SELMODRAFT_426227 [Selaginella moellendorffii]|uniref:Uncharacterized protein n=1 Tax=Selaginella moellendorffii TaxID=88036 RepID=D8SVR6_SELML|nr:hypothetical protein SELMODRAFT_426227 [Selaginella moellendorffii]